MLTLYNENAETKPILLMSGRECLVLSVIEAVHLQGYCVDEALKAKNPHVIRMYDDIIIVLDGALKYVPDRVLELLLGETDR